MNVKSWNTYVLHDTYRSHGNVMETSWKRHGKVIEKSLENVCSMTSNNEKYVFHDT